MTDHVGAKVRQWRQVTQPPRCLAMGEVRFGQVFTLTTWRDRALAAVSQAGLVNNAVDGLAWGIRPLLFAAEGLSLGRIGVLAALYPGVWCVGQLFTGAWSDRVGRKPLIVAGMLLQGAALALMAIADTFAF